MDKYQTFSANDLVKNAYHLQLRLVDNWYNIYNYLYLNGFRIR